MEIVNFQALKKQIIGIKLPQPNSGNLSGHAVSEPFEEIVYKLIKKQLPKNTYKQYEYLNDLYSKNPKVIGYKERLDLFNSPTVMFLLSRGKSATENWNSNNLFEAKQNDTADVLIVKNGFYKIIDIKTRNISKKAQAPNIISAYKLAQTCAKILDNKSFNSFSISYFGLDWELENNNMICKDVHLIHLFKTNPQNLYINWAAAMQIQFHVSELDQSFDKNLEKWARTYLKHFTKQARLRAKYMLDKFVKPFEKYL